MSGVGVVIIGRDEGARLLRCLDSLAGAGVPVVYVDSASRDGSAAAARAWGAEVVELDPSRPHCAALARNEGLGHLLARHPDLTYLQFVDGDTALAPGWLEEARGALEREPGRGLVSGHLAERLAGHDVFHLLCELEWRKDPGPTEATGGNLMARREALVAAGAFDAAVAAGEEADLCQRVRAAGYRVEQLDAPMGVHDLGPAGWRRWWRRSARTGWGYAQGALDGTPPRYVRELRSALAWGVALPSLSALLALALGPAGALLLLAWPAQAARVAVRARRRGWTLRESAWYGLFTVLAKAPEAVGAVRWLRARRRR